MSERNQNLVSCPRCGIVYELYVIRKHNDARAEGTYFISDVEKFSCKVCNHIFDIDDNHVVED